MSATVSYGQLLRENRNFRLLWGGQIVSQLGDWFSAITVQALLLQYTGNATSLAGFMIATMLPGFVLGPIAGVLVDRLPRKTVMVAADLIRAGIALGLLAFRGPETVWVAYLCVTGLYAFSAFFEPARMATLPNVTSEEELVTANALSSVTWSIMLTSGALAGGIISSLFGPTTAFLLNGLSFLGSAVFMLRLKVPPTEHGGSHAGGFGDIVAGFRYVQAHPQILGALTAKMGWGLAGGIQVLITVFGAKVFPLPHDPAGQKAIGILLGAGGLGTALGPVVARRFTGRDLPRIRWAIAISFGLATLYYAALAVAPNLGVAAVCLFLGRFHGAIIWVFSTILLQMLTEDRFRGRVFAAEGSLFTLTMMLSSVGVARALDQHWATVAQTTLAMAAVSGVMGAIWIFRLATGRTPTPAAGVSATPASTECGGAAE